MQSVVGVFVFTRRNKTGPVCAVLHRMGMNDCDRGGEQGVDAGRFRPTCYGPASAGKRPIDAAWQHGFKQLRWQMPSYEKDFVSLVRNPASERLYWTLEMPFEAVKSFRLWSSTGGLLLLERAMLRTIESVPAADIDRFPWQLRKAMTAEEHRALTEAFDVHA